MRAWLFSQTRAQKDADRLLSQVTNASRNPALFGEGRVADTLDGRFELVALHAALALIRLRRQPDLADVAQAFVDGLFRHFDSGLREQGVGDLAVPKRMHKLAGAFYGRVEAYAAALGVDSHVMQAALERNVFRGESVFAAPLARYVRSLADAQSRSPWQTLRGADAWPPFAA